MEINAQQEEVGQENGETIAGSHRRDERLVVIEEVDRIRRTVEEMIGRSVHRGATRGGSDRVPDRHDVVMHDHHNTVQQKKLQKQ